MALSTSVCREQAEAYEASLTTCLTEHPVPGGLDLPAQGDEFWRGWYEAEVETAACLREHGFSVPPDPTIEVFRQGHLQGAGWLPYGELPNLSESEWTTINDACPQWAEQGHDGG